MKIRKSLNIDHENKKLNRSAQNAMRRSLLWNTWLQIKTLTNQTSAFPHFLWTPCIQFSENTFMLIKQHYIYLIGTNIPQIVSDFIIY